MQEALDQARAVLGTTSPNPAVGAVVVWDGRVVGRGATQPPGGAHAEVMALDEAGDAARGATLYVTLEPCAHQGRTPPCTDAIREARIAEVVVAFGDPDPEVDGEGIRALADAGVTVRTGDGATQAALHYEAYAHHRRSGRPFVTAKYAASLDGKIAATSGDSRWVSGPETRARAHLQRPTFDAILVGVGTILLDDPQLTARPGGSSEGVPQPLRVVLDSRGRTPLDARVLQEQKLAPTLIATTDQSSSEWRDAIEGLGVCIAVLESEEGRVALGPLLDRLSGDGVVSLLVEGGGQVHGSFFDAGLVDKVTAIIAPLIIGGDSATAVVGRGAERMRDAIRLRDLSVERLGADLLVTGYPLAPAPDASVRVRVAGADDYDGLLALIEDAAARLDLGLDLERALANAATGTGGFWVAIEGGSEEEAGRVVGGVALAFHDPAWLERADGRHRAGLEQLRVAAEWRAHGLAVRLLESAEAAAEGRGFAWLTALPSPGLTAPSAGPSAAEGESDASGLTPDDWRTRGFRYYRRSPEGASLRIKQLRPESDLEAIRGQSDPSGRT